MTRWITKFNFRNSQLTTRHVSTNAAITLALGVLTCSATAFAQDAENIKFSGFGTLGYAHSSNTHAEFSRDFTQARGVQPGGSLLTDSNLGLQMNLRATDNLEFVVQGVSHYRHDKSFDPELTWAFAKYDLNPRVSFRVGRIGTELLVNSDSRLVGYSYLTVRPPVEYYGGISVNYGDGADVIVRQPIGDGVLRGRMAFVEAKEQLPSYDMKGTQARLWSVAYERTHYQLKFTHAEATLANELQRLDSLRNGMVQMAGFTGNQALISGADQLRLKGNHSYFDSVGFNYDDGTWQFQTALSMIHHEAIQTENPTAGYIQLARRIGNFSPFAGFSWVRSNTKSLVTGDATFDPQIQRTIESSRQRQQTASLGFRWDFARNMDLKAQIDFVHGQPSSTFLYANPNGPNGTWAGWNGKTTVFSLALDFIF